MSKKEQTTQYLPFSIALFPFFLSSHMECWCDVWSCMCLAAKFQEGTSENQGMAD